MNQQFRIIPGENGLRKLTLVLMEKQNMGTRAPLSYRDKLGGGGEVLLATIVFFYNLCGKNYRFNSIRRLCRFFASFNNEPLDEINKETHNFTNAVTYYFLINLYFKDLPKQNGARPRRENTSIEH